MTKDPFQILADELTLIRKDMDRMQRTSLDKDEAQALHQIVAEAVSDMRRATKETPQALQSALKADRDRMARNATQAATEAAERVLGDIREQLAQERQKLSQAAGEARREAWRWFGGFWVWLASVGAAGARVGGVLGRRRNRGPGVWRLSGHLLRQRRGSGGRTGQRWHLLRHLDQQARSVKVSPAILRLKQYRSPQRR